MSKLNLSCDDAVYLLESRLTTDLGSRGFSWFLDESSSPYIGKTNDTAIGGDGSIMVGIRGLYKRCFNQFFHVDSDLFTAALISLEHEVEHNVVWSLICDGKCDTDLFFSHVAKQGSNNYYLYNRYNYVTELDAEYNGVLEAYGVLFDFSPDLAEELICNHVNNQCKNCTYYIDLPKGVDGKARNFESISQIENAFSNAYELATSNEPVRRFNGFPDESKNYREIRTAWSEDESLSFMINEYGQVKSEFKGVFDMMWDASNSDKDKMMASLALYAIPELRDFYGDAVCDSLSVDKVFGDVWPASFSLSKKDVSLLPVSNISGDVELDSKFSL